MALFNEPPTQQLAAHPVCVWHSLRAASSCQITKKIKILQPFGEFPLRKWGGEHYSVSIRERQNVTVASATICYQNCKKIFQNLV